MGAERLRPNVTGVAVVCLAALTACVRARSESPPHARSEPRLRVGLVVGADQAVIGAQGRATVSSRARPIYGLETGVAMTVRADGERLRVVGSDASYPALTVETASASHLVTVDGRPFRGTVNIVAGSNGVTVVNRLGLEDYLMGVVTVELGKRAPGEAAALQAQAVASRTYALRNLGRFDAQGFDLEAGVTDQAYGGVGAEDQMGRRAVRSTRGEVLVYGGELISPFFHSTGGGSTAAPEEAFRTVQSTPYLQPVSDQRPGGYYCDISPRFRWTVQWDGDMLRQILRRTIPGALGVDAAQVDQIRDIELYRRGPSQRAAEVRVHVNGGVIPVFGPDIRAVFTTPGGLPLGSTAIRFTVARAEGEVVRLTADGSGWGHGVGMCQWGAVGRARAGQDYRTIVTTYFPGASIARWY